MYLQLEQTKCPLAQVTPSFNSFVFPHASHTRLDIVFPRFCGWRFVEAYSRVFVKRKGAHLTIEKGTTLRFVL